MKVFLIALLFAVSFLVMIPSVSATTYTEDFEDDALDSDPDEDWYTYSEWMMNDGGDPDPHAEVKSYGGTKHLLFNSSDHIAHQYMANFTFAEEVEHTSISFDYIAINTASNDKVSIIGFNSTGTYAGDTGQTFNYHLRETTNKIQVYDYIADVYVDIDTDAHLDEKVHVNIDFNWTTHLQNVSCTWGTGSGHTGWINASKGITDTFTKRVIIVDGESDVNALLYFDNFTTNDAEAGDIPVNSNPVPANASTNQPFNIDPFNVTTTDPNGDTMNISLWTNNTAGGTWVKWKYTNGVSNGTNSWVGSHDPYFTDLDPNTKYWWSANTTDGTNWDNDTYYFTTNHSYTMSITKTANISTVEVSDTVWDTQLVNYTINVTNTGTGDLTDININESWWNCSCNDWKFWFISTNEPNWETNLTVYTDSCYMSINITNLSAGESYELYILLNVSECAIDTLGTLRNWANVTAEYAPAKSSYCDIAWGEAPAPAPSRDLDIDALVAMIMVFISTLVAVAVISLFIRWLGEVMR